MLRVLSSVNAVRKSAVMKLKFTTVGSDLSQK